MKTRGKEVEILRCKLAICAKSIESDEWRRRQLLAELSALRLREKIIAATEDASWIGPRFVEPRAEELNALEEHLRGIRAEQVRLQAVLADLLREPEPEPMPAWLEMGSILSLTA